MAIWQRHSSSDVEASEEAKHDYSIQPGQSPSTNEGHLSQPEDEKHSLQRGLQSRQVTMIAIGGAIGTGLIIGTGSALAKAGPASILIAYAFVGLIVFMVMAALGEMAAWLPAPGGFSVYATRYVDPALGFALGYVSTLAI